MCLETILVVSSSVTVIGQPPVMESKHPPLGIKEKLQVSPLDDICWLCWHMGPGAQRIQEGPVWQIYQLKVPAPVMVTFSASL